MCLGYVLFMDGYQDIEERLKGMDPAEFIVLDSVMYDTSHYLIVKNRIPHTRVDFESFGQVNWSRVKLLFIGNCGVEEKDEVPEQVIEGIKNYMNGGGKVISHNSGVVVTSACFPDKICFNFVFQLI